MNLNELVADHEFASNRLVNVENISGAQGQFELKKEIAKRVVQGLK